MTSAPQVGDITRCKVCGEVLRQFDPGAQEYVGVLAHYDSGVSVPDEDLHPDFPRRRPAESLEDYAVRRSGSSVLWALCSDDYKTQKAKAGVL